MADLVELELVESYKYKCQQVFTLLLESFWDIFYPYLSNDDIGKIDSALTDKSLREIYIKQVSKFYLTNSIRSSSELEWIVDRKISLTICRFDFAHDLGSRLTSMYKN